MLSGNFSQNLIIWKSIFSYTTNTTIHNDNEVHVICNSYHMYTCMFHHDIISIKYIYDKFMVRKPVFLSLFLSLSLSLYLQFIWRTRRQLIKNCNMVSGWLGLNFGLVRLSKKIKAFDFWFITNYWLQTDISYIILLMTPSQNTY